MDALFISIIINIVLAVLNIVQAFLPAPLGKYVANRLRGARERREKFYEPLKKCLQERFNEIKDYRNPSTPCIEKICLLLLISERTSTDFKELMKVLEELYDAYQDLKIYVYPNVIKMVEEEIKGIEKRYCDALGATSAPEGCKPLPLLSALMEKDTTLPEFLRLIDENREVDLNSFKPLKGLLGYVEKAHVNRELEHRLNIILGYLKSSYVCRRVLELRKRALQLLDKVIDDLDGDIRRLSSRIRGVKYGSGDPELLKKCSESIVASSTTVVKAF
jgi:hypothetical protein